MPSSCGSRRTRSKAIRNAIVPCVPMVSRRVLPGAMTVLAIGGLLVEAGGTAWAEDVAGPVAATQSAPLLLAQAIPVISSAVLGETGAPVVSILQPNYADLLKGKSSVVIGVNASHAGSQTVEMFLDGMSATGGPVALPGMPTTEFKFDTTLFTDGAHRLKVKVTDALGFIGQSETTIYINNGRKVDVTPPLLRWLNVQSGDLLRGDVKFRLQASDNFGIKWVYVKVTPAATPKGQAVRVLFANRPPYDFLFDTTLVPDGVYSLSATAQDAGENEGRAPATFIAVANRTINPTEFDTELNSAIQSSAEARTAVSKPDFGPVQGSDRVSVPLSASGQVPASSGAPKTGTSPRVTERPVARSNPASSTNTASSENAMTTITRRLQPSTSGASSTSSRLASRDSSGDLAPSRIGAPALKQRGTTTRSSRPETASPPRMSTHAATGNAMTIAPFALPTGRASTDRAASRRAQNDAWSDAPVTSKRTVRTGSMPRPAANSAAFAAARPPVTTVRHVVERPLKSVPGTIARPMAAKSVSPSLASHGSMQARVEHSNPMRVGGVTAAPRPRVSTRTLAAQMSSQAGITLTPMAVNSDARIAANGGMQEVAPIESTLLPQASGTISQPFVAPRSTAPRVAALPPVISTRRNGPVAAITVAPISSDNALPALHVVARGETLGSIAARWKVPSAVLAASNNLKPSARVLAGTTLRLPRPLKVSFGGKSATGDVTALMVGSTSVTPFRFLFEQQGGSLQWDAARQRVVARNATQEITLTIGSRAALVNRQQVMMDLAAFLLSGRTMVPVRFFEKALHAQVDWEPVSGRLYISMAPPA